MAFSSRSPLTSRESLDDWKSLGRERSSNRTFCDFFSVDEMQGHRPSERNFRGHLTLIWQTAGHCCYSSSQWTSMTLVPNPSATLPFHSSLLQPHTQIMFKSSNCIAELNQIYSICVSISLNSSRGWKDFIYNFKHVFYFPPKYKIYTLDYA